MIAGSTRDSYKPRRAALKRWLEGAPEHVLDVFYNKRYADCYTVFLTGPHLVKMRVDKPHSTVNTRVPYFGCDANAGRDPQGIGMWGEMAAHQAADYRYHAARRHRIKWADLPEAVRVYITEACEA